MVSLKCKMCGGTLEIESGATIGTCEFCGTKQTLPKSTDEKVTNLFNRANNLRLKCEFDKAISIYEKIVEQDDSESEAHWGIVLCRYGIEYVEDPATMTRIPTCHRTLYEPVSKDVDYQAAVDFADAFQQAIYEKEARAIDRIQKDILAIVQNESPFDVFICYKETDEEGKRTKDSVFANDIYYQLTQEGFKVFFAAITLEDKLGQEYEPYIFAALNTAKVMLVIGSKPEYFNAVWVKNEWSRFMNFMKTDRSKILIPCYRDMDAYDLPEDFAHLQAQDMGKIGFINDVIRGIKKIIPKSGNSQSVQTGMVSRNENTPATVQAYNPSSLLERGFLFLEDGKWRDADSYFEKVLDIEPKNSQAYLGKLLAGLNIKKKEDLITCKKSFRNNDNYGKVIRFGSEPLKNEIESILKNVEFEEHYCWLIEEVNGSRVSDSYGSDFHYDDKIDEMERIAARYNSFAEEFKKIGDYKASSLFLNKCTEESIKLREKIRRIKISSEEERVRKEKEEFDKHYRDIKETIDRSLTADDYGSDYNFENKIDEMERNAARYDNFAEEFKKIGEYKEAVSYFNKCLDESNKLREKVKIIKKSSEEERLRKEKEEQKRKEKERLNKIEEDLNGEIDPIIDNVFAYKVGYNKYHNIKLEGDKNIKVYEQTIYNLEELKEKIHILEAKKEKIKTLYLYKKTCGVLDFSRKKAYDNEIDKLSNEVNIVDNDIEKMKRLIRSNIELSKDEDFSIDKSIEFFDDASIDKSIKFLRQLIEKCKFNCPELEKLHAYFSRKGMVEIINSSTDFDIDKISKYILATDYFEKEEYEKTFILLDDIKDFCDSSYKLQLLRDKYSDRISELLINNHE